MAIMPRIRERTENIVITKKKLIYALVILLTFFCAYKINSTGRLSTDLITNKVYLVLSQVSNINDKAQYASFTRFPFCGWRLSNAEGGLIASDDFNANITDDNILSQEITLNNVKQNFSVCVSAYEAIDSSVKRQVFALFLISGILLALLYTTRFVEDEEDETIPNA